MIFRDVTLSCGAVRQRQLVDTRELTQPAVELAGDILAEIRTGLASRGPGMSIVSIGDVTFGVALGMPPQFGKSPGNRLCFCATAPDEFPFQFNALIHAGSDREEALWAISTLLGISLSHGGERNWTAARLQETAEPLFEERPILLSTVLPVPGATPERIILCADFSKCFAAAWLLEG